MTVFQVLWIYYEATRSLSAINPWHLVFFQGLYRPLSKTIDYKLDKAAL